MEVCYLLQSVWCVHVQQIYCEHHVRNVCVWEIVPFLDEVYLVNILITFKIKFLHPLFSHVWDPWDRTHMCVCVSGCLYIFYLLMWCLIPLYDAIIIARSMCGLAAYSQVISSRDVDYFKVFSQKSCFHWFDHRKQTFFDEFGKN